MKVVNIHEAKTQLSKLVEEASRGESFVIAKAGKPVAKSRLSALHKCPNASARFYGGPDFCARGLRPNGSGGD